jgi:phosphate-selective porin OprO and OprP
MPDRRCAATLLSIAMTASLSAAEPTLEERVQALELQLATEHQRLDTTPRGIANSKDGFGIASADGTYRLKVWGYLQGEGRFFLNDEAVPLTNTFVLRRARIIAEGSVGPFDFRVMPEFGNGTTVLLDAYVSSTMRPWLKVQAGRGKVPVGLEFLQNDTVIMFIERGYPTQLVPNRDNGLQVSGDLGGGVLSYTVGVYNGAVDAGSRDTDTNDDKDGVVRLYATPFLGGAPALAGWSFGVGASYGQEEGTVTAIAGSAAAALPTYKSPGQATIFQYSANVYAKGERWRLAPQAYYAMGPFSAMAEYTRSSQEVRLAAVSDTVANQAWQFSLGWVLTGENAVFKGLTPASPLALNGGGWGALEVVARAHRLAIDDVAFERNFSNPTTQIEQATGYAFGLNWYLTKQVRLKLDYEHTRFVGGGGGTPSNPQDREGENLFSAQVQLVF